MTTLDYADETDAGDDVVVSSGGSGRGKGPHPPHTYTNQVLSPPFSGPLATGGVASEWMVLWLSQSLTRVQFVCHFETADRTS